MRERNGNGNDNGESSQIAREMGKFWNITITPMSPNGYDIVPEIVAYPPT